MKMRQSETKAQDSGPEASLLESPGVMHQPAVPRDPPDPEGRKRAQVTQVSGIKRGRIRHADLHRIVQETFWKA